MSSAQASQKMVFVPGDWSHYIEAYSNDYKSLVGGDSAFVYINHGKKIIGHCSEASQLSTIVL